MLLCPFELDPHTREGVTVLEHRSWRNYLLGNAAGFYSRGYPHY
jgi:hypothetical protein